MTKVRRSNKEAKKTPTMTMKEKKAARKSKKEAKSFVGSENAARIRKPAP